MRESMYLLIVLYRSRSSTIVLSCITREEPSHLVRTTTRRGADPIARSHLCRPPTCPATRALSPATAGLTLRVAVVTRRARRRPWNSNVRSWSRGCYVSRRSRRSHSSRRRTIRRRRWMISRTIPCRVWSIRTISRRRSMISQPCIPVRGRSRINRRPRSIRRIRAVMDSRAWPAGLRCGGGA